ncbi:MAG TPA: 4-hydroxythreonine-4-phosphate dehydrogenase PdxA [Candidatus Limnocylindrales bacterium]|nr:4-hydroxythreonine-4-phosphate dehydrogenase PdxA [Candidatus Limnocylindrales bacterium]
MKPQIAVSLGDPAGIGPEIVVEAASRAAVRRACRLVVYGDEGVMAAARRIRRIGAGAATAIERIVPVTSLPVDAALPRPGKRCGEAAFRFLDAAARATAAGEHAALATAPLSKLWLNRAGHPYDGHTEYLSELAGTPATMMLAGPRLRVVLVTTHVAIARVPQILDVARIVKAGRVADEHLRAFHGLKKPRLAVAALNPHAGEGGLFGDEEARVIAPAVARLRRAGIDASGPFPADTLFAAVVAGDYDAVLCMYHDQALIPLKLVDFRHAVNISMGLPFLRTSPDHGTAYDLAGSGRASADSMEAAILLAAAMAERSAATRAPARSVAARAPGTIKRGAARR